VPVHSRDDIRGSMLDDIYASSDTSVRLPKYNMPDTEQNPEHAEIAGRPVSQLAAAYPETPILRVVRAGKVIEPDDDPMIVVGDTVMVRADVHDLILEGTEVIGPGSDDPDARNIALETADIHVAARAFAGMTLEKVGHKIAAGVHVTTMFRGGHEIPVGPNTDVRMGNVLRVTGPDRSVRRTAERLGSKPIVETTFTEVSFLALAMFVAYFRSRDPEFGGPVSEGARSLLQDIGLNLFVAVLAANVGPKVVTVLGGDTVI